MKIGIMSDLHMHRGQPWDFVPQVGVVYVCAGDISEDDVYRNEFKQKHLPYMFAIDGNHDYFGLDFKHTLYHKQIREIQGVTIAGATLWTDLSDNMDWYRYVKKLIDHKYIDGVSHERMIETHESHKKFLLESEVDVIVSHHCPSYQSVHPKYINNENNACFATELAEQILSMRKPPKLWVHGHTHEKFDYMIGDTRVVCHPRGYRGENHWYNDYTPLIIEI